ncbi:MAG: aminotransferase class I/II-fold pyridoxal phosphate-dependent enzyme [Alphaproteobacteria bacterium]|nr:aminotransferase class I/II-fold pyridoxal phosphate-dependent enzyme [Alphaproteobacteria bacterium]
MTEPRPLSGLERIQPYRPGAQVASAKARLAANENPLGPSPAALAAARDELARAQYYPAGGAPELVAALARQHDLPPENLICGAGSDELIYMLNLAYAGVGGVVLYPRYGFAMYRLSALACRAEPVAVALDAGERLSVADLKTKLAPAPRILFFATPENPLGSVLPVETARAAVAAVPSETLVVIDCAYAEYMPRDYQRDTLALAREHSNVVMLRTFSKAYGLAGLRIGWAYAAAPVIETLHRVRHPFNVSRMAAAVAVAALGDQEWIRKSAEHNNAARLHAEQRLRDLGLEPRGEGGNFLRFDLPASVADDADAAEAALAGEGVLLRSLGSYGLPRTLRITLGRDDEMNVAFAALERLLAASDG